jgi:hypothetical protein
MLKDRSASRVVARRRIVTMAAMALIVPLASLAAASPAAAAPKGIFEVFKACPTEQEDVSLCSVDTTTSGEFKLGTSKVTINKEIIQQGGFVKTGNPENGREFYGVPAKTGYETLSKTELNVPGGIAGLVNCEEITGSGLVEKAVRALCKEILEKGPTAVTATTELVATPSNRVLFNERAFAREVGTAVTLPIRVHLQNPLLGSSCYIGSESHPIQLELTTGETHPPAGVTPLHGTKGEAVTLEEEELLTIRARGSSLVDNDFSAPGAEGCGELLLVKGFLDSIIDGKLKIPNSAGENAAVLDGELAAAAAEEVILSESF